MTQDTPTGRTNLKFFQPYGLFLDLFLKDTDWRGVAGVGFSLDMTTGYTSVSAFLSSVSHSVI